MSTDENNCELQNNGNRKRAVCSDAPEKQKKQLKLTVTPEENTGKSNDTEDSVNDTSCSSMRTSNGIQSESGASTEEKSAVDNEKVDDVDEFKAQESNTNKANHECNESYKPSYEGSKDEKSLESFTEFVNPFAAVAKTGSVESFLSSGFNEVEKAKRPPFLLNFDVQHLKGFGTQQQENENLSNEEEEELQATSPELICTFPGEEEECVEFVVNSAVIFKSINVLEETHNPNSNSDEYTQKYRRQGEGNLKILVSKTLPVKGRILMRQKGTWRVLLNSPINTSPKFELLDHMNNGVGIKFIAIDEGKMNEENAENKAIFSPYCIKFHSYQERTEFIDTANKFRSTEHVDNSEQTKSD